MNILFVPSASPNGLEDVVYSGLNKIDSIKIHEYPFKPSYHPDLMSHEDLNKYFLMGVKPSWLLQSGNVNHIYYSIDDVDIDDFDYIIFGSTKTEVLPMLSRSIENAPERTVFIDGEDDPLIRLLLKDVKVYFKREKLDRSYLPFKGLNRGNIATAFTLFSKGVKMSPLVVPIPQFPYLKRRIYSLNMTVIEHKYDKYDDLDIDVSLVAKPTNKLRFVYSAALKNIAKRYRLNVYVNNNDLSPFQYRNIILHSKLVVSLPGAGYDTFRYWEIPYYERCLLSYRLPITIEHNFIDHESALFFSSVREFEEKILWGLKSENYERLRRYARDQFVRFHTDLHRASKVIGKIIE